MSKSYIFIILFIPIILSQDLYFPEGSSSSFDAEVSSFTPNYGLRIIADSVGNAGLDINKIESNKNNNYTVLSPTSIASALLMVLLGSNGHTYKEIYNFLRLNPLSYIEIQDNILNILSHLKKTGNQNNIIEISNGLFVQKDYPISTEYRDTITNYFQAEIKSFDFEQNAVFARDFINSWIQEKTHGKIRNILGDPPNADTKMILVNSLYFKGFWEKPFPSHLTKMQKFYPKGHTNNEKIQVPMMATKGTFKHHYDSYLDLDLVGLPYLGREIVFYLVLPKNSNPEKLKNLENQLTYNLLNRLINNSLDTSEMIVALPKMKLTSTINLNTVLQKLGIVSLFDPSRSDLSLISSQPFPKQTSNIFEDDPLIFSRSDARLKRQTPKSGLITKGPDRKVLSSSGLYVNEIIHKVTIDIDENGTEAAASTVVMFDKTLSITVKADAPFMFFIRHEESNLILFQGSVIVPIV